MRRIVSLLLTLVLLLTCVPAAPVTARATEAEEPHIHAEKSETEELTPEETSTLTKSLITETEAIPTVQIGREAKATNIFINGIDIGYANDGYFTKSGGPCMNDSFWPDGRCHHKGVCDKNPQHEHCNCIYYWPSISDCQVNLKAAQCFGFARFCQWKVYGTYDLNTPSNFVDLTGKINASSCTADVLKSKLINCAPATHVRTLESVKGYGHSICIISTSDLGVRIADCNKDGYCGVRDIQISWAELAKEMKDYGGVAYANSWKDGLPITFFDFWSGEDGETISDKHTFWWKQDGYGSCDVNLDLNGKALGTIYPDENGLFSYTLDTTKYENGTYTLGAIIRSSSGLEKYVTRTIHIDNGSFGFWSGEDGEAISGTHKFWWKQTGYESCDVNLALNGKALGTIYPDENGLFSYTLDTTKYENGTYTISAVIRSSNKSEKTVSRTIHIDNGEMSFGFWSGEDGEAISGTHKFWWKQVGYEDCDVTIDINGNILTTRYPDENGLISYTLDTTKYENGSYTISAIIRSTNKSEKTVSRTIHIDNGEMSFGFWSGEDGEIIRDTYKFWWKQVGYGDCDVTLDMNGEVLTTISADENGLISYTLDTTKYENGTYTIGANIQGANGSEKYVTRIIHIKNFTGSVEPVVHFGGTANCTSPAICEHCGQPYGELDYTKHSYVEEVISPTCDEQGYTVHVCMDCGDSYTDSYAEPLGHSGGTANCTSAANCERCGQPYGELDYDTHSYAEEVIDPTCNEQGYTVHVCMDCGDWYTDSYAEPLGHGGGTANCTFPANCERCGQPYGELDYDTHSYAEEVIDPTCNEQGFTVYLCMDCGSWYMDSYVDATGHSFGQWTEVDAPTCTEKGSDRRDCANCDHFETRETDAKGHDYVDGKCSNCGESDPDYVPARLLGDVTGDGKVTATDYSRLLAHVKKVNPITDADSLWAADVTGDGKITATDYSRLLAHVKKVNPLW